MSTLIEDLRSRSAQAAARKEEKGRRSEEIKREVQTSIEEIFQREYAPLLRKAADEGHSSVLLMLGPEIALEAETEEYERFSALRDVLKDYLEGQGLKVGPAPDESMGHGGQFGIEFDLLVTWSA